MRKILTALALLLYTNGQVDFGTYAIDDVKKIDTKKSTVTYEADTNYKNCICDRNQDMCDPFCCCDTSCKPETIKDWQNAQKCADIDYFKDRENISGFSECFPTSQDQLDYNTKKGLFNYISPFNVLTCVRISNNPRMGTYFIDTPDTHPNSTEITKINNNANKQAFRNKLYGSQSGNEDISSNYPIGQMMSSVVDNGS